MVDATIIIAAWCAEAHLSRAVQSAADQEGVDLEIVVIDDASPDRTAALAADWASRDDRVRVVSLPTNGGPAAARNAGLKAARGRWVCVLDADDAMAPGRVARMIAFGERQGADAVYDDFQPMNETGRAVGPSHLAPYGLDAPARWDLEAFLAGDQAQPGKPNLGYLKPLLRMEFLLRHRLAYNTSLRNGEDFHLMAELLASGGSLWIMPEAGYLYTARRGSISNRLDLDHAEALAAADAAFLACHADAISNRAVALMRSRQKRFGDLCTAEAVLKALRSGRPLTGARALLRRPRATPRVARQLWSAVERRLT